MSDSFSDPQSTLNQSAGQQRRAEQLSLSTSTPPAEVPGYRIERFLGSGAFGQVWVARDLNTGRAVAIKFYMHRSGVNWSLLNREVKSLVALSADRHVVQVLEVGWDSEPPFYVMEFVENGSLEDLMQVRGRLPVEQAVGLLRDICQGLSYTHGKGILHCDLKPANILLDDNVRPRLADFGQSRLSHEQSPTLGTLFYMAPEQADLESSPDVRWDVYGLGAIAFRMLTGTAPHRQGSLLSELDTAASLSARLHTYRSTIEAAGAPTEHLRIAGVDRRLGAIVQRCLEPDPACRFANVQQVMEMLDQRDAAKTRRPLILLGIVGPVMLLLAMGLFAISSIRMAGKQFTQAMREERSNTNLSVAGEKSRALEIELHTYFDLVDHEAGRKDLHKAMQSMYQNDALTPLRDQIASTPQSDQAEKSRAEILDRDLCQSLNDYLHRRLEYYNSRADMKVGVPRLATMFVTDRQGTIIGIAYSDPPSRETTSLGRNYAYRTYFSGLKTDLPAGTPVADVGTITTQTHLSSAFQSTATSLWKVAVSTPICLAEPDSRAQEGLPIAINRVDGVLVATTNFGDFEPFQLGDSKQLDVIGVLVDARPGPNRGTILQHPWMSLSANEMQQSTQRFQIAGDVMDQLLAGGDFDYHDPFAGAPGGQPFRGNWIAAVQPVKLPRTGSQVQSSRSQSDQRTDWIVLVQFRLSKAIARVDSLTNQLIVEGIMAAITIMLINAVLWYFVRRVNRGTPSDTNTPHSAEPSPSAVAMQATMSLPD